MLTPASTIAIIGFGNTGSRITAQLAPRGCALRCYDRLLDAEATRALFHERIEAAGADPMYTLADALRGARLVIAAVGAPGSVDLMYAVTPLLSAGQTLLDLSAAAAAVRSARAALVARHRAQYVAGQPGEPMLLAGSKASELAAALDALGCTAIAISALPQAPFPEYPPARDELPRLHGDAQSRTPWPRGELP